MPKSIESLRKAAGCAEGEKPSFSAILPEKIYIPIFKPSTIDRVADLWVLGLEAAVAAIAHREV